MTELSFADKMKEAIAQKRADGTYVAPDHNLAARAAKDPTSKSKAIAAMCFQCFGGTKDEMPDPGWKRFIGGCTSPDCALFHLRPHQGCLDCREEDGENPSGIDDQG